MIILGKNSVFPSGKYKGVKVSDVKDSRYIKWLHENRDINVLFKDEVLLSLKIKPRAKAVDFKNRADFKAKIEWGSLAVSTATYSEKPSFKKSKKKQRKNPKPSKTNSENPFKVVSVGYLGDLHIKQRLNKGKGSFPEQQIESKFRSAGIFYIREVQFNTSKYFFDFYIPQVNTAIEYDGIDYHSNPSDVIRDSEKSEYLKSIGVELISIDKNSWGELGKFINRVKP